MLFTMHNDVINENGVNSGGIDTENGWKCYVKKLETVLEGPLNDYEYYSLENEILSIDRKHYENLCVKEYARNVSFYTIFLVKLSNHP